MTNGNTDLKKLKNSHYGSRMKADEALELADALIYAKLGKHLNDLEREVFLGSWQGKTYEEIYPLNPSYIEKYVGYKLWQKFSEVLEEKVTKKKIHGAIERAKKQRISRNPSKSNAVQAPTPTTHPIVVRHPNRQNERALAQSLETAIAAAGYPVVMATTPYPIDPIPSESDTLIFFISTEVATSEIAIEELRHIREVQNSRLDGKPTLIPVCVNCPPERLNHDLRSSLDNIVLHQWHSPSDTPRLIAAIFRSASHSGSLAPELDSPSAILLEDGEKTAHSPHEDSPLERPSPVAEPELPKGQVRLSSAFYVERIPYEQQCYSAIAQPGALIRLKAPRQMGKTSLMARILDRCRDMGYRTVPLSFQHADRVVFANLNELLRWFCAKIARKLRLREHLDEYWTETYGSKDNCTIFFEDCLLLENDTPLVLGLDEVDRVFDYPSIADDFFSLLRAWYEDAGRGDSDSELWERLRLVVVHSTEVYIPMDINQSPFNVGLPVELSEFTAAQVEDLAQRHGLNWRSRDVETLMRVVGGHPYLVRLALYHIAQQELTLTELVETAATEAGIYGDHLRWHLWNLQKYSELAEAFSEVILAEGPVELRSVFAFKLHSMGLVHLQGDRVAPRFELYRNYFRDRVASL
ncbi:MAG: AAA-like domain-containing protein [Cyanobacteriota bacterium]|nr:AAA-like domain-containing protein [Cyanobacteriota bacterium]